MNKNLLTIESLSFNSHLSNCDLINKYLLKSIYTIPKLDSIGINFSLLESLKIFNKKNSVALAKDDVQIHTFLLLYIFSNYFPFIKIHKNKNIDDFSNECNLKLFFNQKNQKEIFLKKIFIEAWHSLKSLKLFKTTTILQKDKFIIKKNKTNVTVLLPLNCFIEIDDLLQKSNKNSKESLIQFKFTFSHLNFTQEKVIENLPFFWVSG